MKLSYRGLFTVFFLASFSDWPVVNKRGLLKRQERRLIKRLKVPAKRLKKQVKR